MRVLLLSAYDAQSHRYWHEGLRRYFDQWQWTVLTLPPRYFSWRIRGNSLSWAFTERERLSQDYDLLIATSMVDLTALRGFVPSLGKIPTLVYFHENQFAYPVTSQAREDVTPQVINLYSALCADRVVFNSSYNLKTCLEGMESLLARLPDQVPSGLIDRVRDRSVVLPVPLVGGWSGGGRRRVAANELWRDSGEGQTVRLLWAARWEYDKGPQLLLECVHTLLQSGVDFRLCVLGEQFRRIPDAFAEIKRCASEHLVQFGYEPDGAHFRTWLKSADVVLSTAEHEFQGLAVQQAVLEGCLPLVPDRLSYPELFPALYRYPVEGLSLRQQAEGAIKQLQLIMSNPEPGRIDTDAWCWVGLGPRYRLLFEQMLSAAHTLA